MRIHRSIALAIASLVSTTQAADQTSKISVNTERAAYYGDLHLHTSYSFDNYILGDAQIDPQDAYRFARGESVRYLGEEIRLATPLDFLAVTDHAVSLGLFNTLDDPDS